MSRVGQSIYPTPDPRNLKDSGDLEPCENNQSRDKQSNTTTLEVVVRRAVVIHTGPLVNTRGSEMLQGFSTPFEDLGRATRGRFFFDSFSFEIAFLAMTNNMNTDSKIILETSFTLKNINEPFLDPISYRKKSA